MARISGTILFLLIFIIIIILYGITANSQPSKIQNQPSNNQISLHLNTPNPKISSSTGHSNLLIYTFHSHAPGWNITACQKKGTAAFLAANPSAYSALKHLPITPIKGQPITPSFINAADQPCTTFHLTGIEKESIRIGAASTIISIKNQTATYAVTPSTQYCENQVCRSQIWIINTDTTNLTINSQDLSVSVPNANTSIHYADLNTIENYPITLVPNQTGVFDLTANMTQPFTTTKWNTSLYYGSQNWTIDPLFIHRAGTTTAQASTSLSNTSFAAVWCDENTDTLHTQAFNTTGTNLTNPFIVDANTGQCPNEGDPASISTLNDTHWAIGWSDLTTPGSEDANWAIYGIGGLLTSGTEDDDMGNGHTVSVAALNQTDFILGWSDDGTGGEKMTFSHIRSDGTTIQSGATMSSISQDEGQEAALAAFNTSLWIMAWHDEGSTELFYSVRNYNGISNELITTDQIIDTNMGSYSEIAISTLNDTHFGIAWIDNGIISVATRSYQNQAHLNQTQLDVVGTTEENIQLSSINSTWFIVEWTDNNPNTTKAIVMDVFGTNRTNTTIINNQNIDGISVTSRNHLSRICDQNVILGYANTTIFSTNTSTLEAWDGNCAGTIPTGDNGTSPTIQAINATPDPVQQGLFIHINASITDQQNDTTNVTVIINQTGYQLTNQTTTLWFNNTINTSVLGVQNHTYNVYANDTFGNTTNMSDSFEVIEQFCVENWQPIVTACVNNLEFIQYQDLNACSTNASLPADNGTLITCNRFSCFLNPNFYLERRMETFCEFPENKAPNTYSCVSKVRTLDGDLIQTNPRVRTINNHGTITSFKEQNHLVNVYFENRDLARDQTFNFSVECTNSTGKVTDSLLITLQTEPFYAAGDRLIWLRENTNLAFGIFLIVILIIAIVWFLWHLSTHPTT